MRITEQEHEIRKNRMLHAAYDLFCEHGIDCVSLARVAKKAGVSPNSIFRYFDTKAVLVQCTQFILWEEIMAKILSDSKEQLVTCNTGFEEISLLLTNFQHLFEHHSKYVLFACDFKLYLVRNHIKLPENTQDQLLRPVFSTFTKALERGHKDGSILSAHSISAQFFAIWGVMRGFVDEIVIYDQMYYGDNPWKSQFFLVLSYILQGLKA